MLSRVPALMHRYLGRAAPVVMFGARLYLALVVIQFVAGFAIGAWLALFDYDLETLSALVIGG